MRKLVIAVVAIFVAGMILAPTEAALRSPQVDIKPGPSNEKSLSTILSTDAVAGIFSSGSINVFTEQVGFANFTPLQSTNASMIVEFAGYSPYTTFGMYDSNGAKVQIFAGSQGAGATATIKFGDINAAFTTVAVNDVQLSNSFGTTFGFYINPNGGSQYFYTEDSKNPGGAAQAVIFQGDGVKTFDGSPLTGTFGQNDFILAWEDKQDANTIEPDFNDMVVLVSGITTNDNDPNPSVPEPATLAIWSIFGAGAAAVGAVRRRRGWTNTKREAIFSVIDRHSV